MEHTNMNRDPPGIPSGSAFFGIIYCPFEHLMKVVAGTSSHRNTHTHKIFMYHFREFRAPEIHHANLRNPQISMDPPLQPSLSDSDGLPARYLHKL